MTATTVPPPGLGPIGARELRAYARRFLCRGLFLSAVGHLTLLSLFIAAQARGPDEAPRWLTTPVSLVPTPPVIRTPPPLDPSAVPNSEIDKGPPIWKPVPEFGPPDVENPIGGKPNDSPNGAGSGPPTTVRTTGFAPPDTGDTIVEFYEKAPVPLHCPEPVYPDWAREARIEGRVVLHALVGSDGRVKRVRVIRDVTGLSGPAREAIARWIFRPAKVGGRPVTVWVEIPIEFKL